MFNNYRNKMASQANKLPAPVAGILKILETFQKEENPALVEIQEFPNKGNPGVMNQTFIVSNQGSETMYCFTVYNNAGKKRMVTYGIALPGVDFKYSFEYDKEKGCAFRGKKILDEIVLQIKKEKVKAQFQQKASAWKKKSKKKTEQTSESEVTTDGDDAKSDQGSETISESISLESLD